MKKFLFILFLIQYSILDESDESSELLPELDLVELPGKTDIELKCDKMRTHLKALPSYDPVDTSFLGYFKKTKKPKQNSFRHIALSMLDAVLDDQPQHQYFDIKDDLIFMKERYYDAYIAQISVKTFESKEIIKAKKKREVAQRKLDTLEKESKGIWKEVKRLKTQLNKTIDKNSDFYSFMQNSKKDFAIFSYALKSVHYYFKFDKYVTSFTEFLNYFNFSNELISKVNQPTRYFIFINFIKKLIAKIEIIRYILASSHELKIDEIEETTTNVEISQNPNRLDEMTNLSHLNSQTYEIDNIILEKNPKVIAAKLKDFDKILKKLETLKEKYDNKISNIITKFESKITEKLNELKNSVRKNTQYKAYVSDVDSLIRTRKKAIDIDSKITNLNSIIEELDIKIGVQGYEQKSDYAIPRDTTKNLYKKLHLIEKFQQENYLEIPDQIKPYLTLDMVNKLQKLNNPKIVSQYFLQNKRRKIVGKIQLIDDILNNENIIDSFLGIEFAHLQNNENEFKCFSLSELSFVLFTMMKTNIIINEKLFLTEFLNQLNDDDAKQFIIFNYKIYMNERYMNSFLNNHAFKEGIDNSLEKYNMIIKTQFIDNQSIMINLYKEMTQYGIEKEDSDIVKVPLGQRFLRMIGLGFDYLFPLLKDSTYTEFLGIVAEEMLKCIPMIGNIPFLASIVATLLGYFIDYIIELVVSHWGDIKEGFDKLFSIVRSGLEKLNKSKIVTLDYEKYIQEILEKQEIKEITPDIEKSKEQFESLYRQAYFDENNIENQISKFHLYKGSFFELRKNDLFDKSIQTELNKSEYAPIKEIYLKNPETSKILLEEMSDKNDEDLIAIGRIMTQNPTQSNDNSFITENIHYTNQEVHKGDTDEDLKNHRHIAKIV
jgi:hypothetical protein